MEILKVIRQPADQNSKKIIRKVLEALKKGNVVVFPTDTVYGLICDATNKKAVKKIFKIKNRPKNKPSPIFVSDIEMAKEIAEINPKQEKFLRKKWPGKLSARLERNLKQKVYGVDKKTIVLRIPDYKLVNILLKKINRPLTGTSANLSGQPASGNIKEALRQFEDQKYRPDLVIDAGILPKSKPSTIIDLTVSPPKILRL